MTSVPEYGRLHLSLIHISVMNTMATFPEAAIDDGYLTEIRERDSFTV